MFALDLIQQGVNALAQWQQSPGVVDAQIGAWSLVSRYGLLVLAAAVGLAALVRLRSMS
ncbi:MAG: hypothetical protein HYX52_00275 [Chloroflexi bacterium]|nr:hypothetical protein [Chloroflexota bacterium]